jgi:CubicO group peptidase (beta-lactamase class C family)
MFQTAGYAVGTASGGSWADFVKERILRPLDMTAYLTTKEAEAAPELASPHRPDAQGRLRVIPRYRTDTPDPAGSVHASARELSKWVRFQRGDGTWQGKRLVSARNLAETHSPQIVIPLEGSARAMNPDTLQMSYGMAWVIQDYRGHLLVSHAGAIDGFRAHLTLLPRDGYALALLSNRHQTRMNLALSNALVDRLLGLPPRDWTAFYRAQERKQEEDLIEQRRKRQAARKRGTRPSLGLAAYAGVYEEPAYGRAEVKREGDRLVVLWGGLTFGLEHHHFDTFTAAVVAPKEETRLADRQLLEAHFRLGGDGEVEALRFLDQDFRRARPAGK